MKTRITSWRNKYCQLVIDSKKKGKIVLANMSLQEGTGCWSIEDVRLSKYKKAGEWFSIGAEDYCAHVRTKNGQESELVRGLLREFKETTEEGSTLFTWCSYDGIVGGESAKDLVGYEGCLEQLYLPIYHKKKDATLILEEIADFWSKFEVSENDADVIEKVSAVKIDNPLRQPSQTEVDMKVFMFSYKP